MPTAFDGLGGCRVVSDIGKGAVVVGYHVHQFGLGGASGDVQCHVCGDVYQLLLGVTA